MCVSCMFYNNWEFEAQKKGVWIYLGRNLLGSGHRKQKTYFSGLQVFYTTVPYFWCTLKKYWKRRDLPCHHGRGSWCSRWSPCWWAAWGRGCWGWRARPAVGVPWRWCIYSHQGSHPPPRSCCGPRSGPCCDATCCSGQLSYGFSENKQQNNG